MNYIIKLIVDVLTIEQVSELLCQTQALHKALEPVDGVLLLPSSSIRTLYFPFPFPPPLLEPTP